MSENKNLNTEKSEKKHNKLVSWFLGLPKWGKILLVGGLTAGVATAVTVPTVLALTKSAPEVEITKEDALKMADGFIYKNGDATDTKDCVSKLSGLNLNWDCNELGWEEISVLIEKIQPYTNLKDKDISKLYKSSLKVTNLSDFKTCLVTDRMLEMITASMYLTKTKLSEGFSEAKCYKKGSDLVIKREPGDPSKGTGYAKMYYNSKGLLTKLDMDMTSPDESSGGTIVSKLNGSVSW